VLATYTSQRKIGGPLPRLLNGLLGSLCAFKGGSVWRDLARRVGGLGSLRNPEATCGADGWHPRLHESAFFEGAVNRGAVDLSDIVSFLRSRRLDALNASGFAASWSHGAVNLMLAMIRLTRFRVLVATASQFIEDEPFDAGGAPSEAAAAAPASAPASEYPCALAIVHDLRIHVDPYLGSGRTESAFYVGRACARRFPFGDSLG
jgi:hypothetical protein